jgi:hypothetical protein
MTATLSVREVARRIQRGEPLETVVSRLRNWSKTGLLRPTGEKNPGTGRQRHYTESAVIDALILSTLTETLSLPAVEVAKIRDAERKTVLQLARLAAERFDEVERAGGRSWLVIHHRWPFEPLRPGEPPFTVELHERRAREGIVIPDWSAASTVLNLTPLFRHLRSAEKYDE